MADYDIELGIGLQQNAKQTLESEIANIKRQLSKDKSLAITAHLSDNSLATIQHQLDAISKNLSIKINTVDLQQLTNGIPNIAKQAGQNFGKIMSDAAEKSIKDVTSQRIGKYFTVTDDDSREFQSQMKKLVSQWTKGKGNLVDVKIDTQTVFDKEVGENVERLRQATVKYTNAAGEAIKKTIAWRQIGTTLDQKGKEVPLYGFVEAASQYSKAIDEASVKTDNFIKKKNKLTTDYTKNINSIESQVNDKGSNRVLKDTAHLDEVSKRITDIKTAITNLSGAGSDTFDSQANNIEILISSLRDLIKTYQNAEYAATSLRTKDISTVKDIQSNKLDEFKAKIKNSNVPLSEMEEDLKKLDKALKDAFDTESLTKFFNLFDIADSKFKSLKEQFKAGSASTTSLFDYSALEKELNNVLNLRNKMLAFNGRPGYEDRYNYYKEQYNSASAVLTNLYKTSYNQAGFEADKWQAIVQEILKATNAKQNYYNSYGNADDEDISRKIGLSIDSLQKRMELFKNQTATKLFSSNTEKAQELRDKFYNLAESIKNAETEYKNLRGQDLKNKKKEVADLNKEFSNLTNEVAAAGYKTKSLGQIFVDSFKSFSQYYFAGGALVKSIQTVDKLVDKVTELNKSFVNLKIATNGTDSEVASLMSTYNEMGKTLGATTVEVADSADQWLRQGYSIEDTNRLIEASMIQSKIGQLESADSTKYLTSALKGYKLEVEDAMSVVDKMSAVDLKSATSLGGLAEGMSEVANSARLAGISMDKLLGYEAVIGETTQDSMSSVGQSLKRIFARMGNVKAGKFVDEDGENLNDVEKVLGKLGIKLRDSQNEFRNFGDVLDEVGGKWSTYSSVEQNAITTALAGTQQSEKLRVLFEGYGKALEYTQVAANSAGTAMEKFGAYQDGIEAKTKKLQASIESLAQTVLNSDLISTGIDGLNLLINGLDTIIGKLGSLGTIATIGSGILGANGVS